jgi:hypothetical protein
MAILVLACLLVLAAVVAGIVMPEGVPVLSYLNPSDIDGPVANREGKKDRLAVLPAAPDRNAASLPESLRQAFASDSPVTLPAPNMGAPVAIPFPAPLPPPRPRFAGRPLSQKNYSLLSEIQIAAIKGRLQLTAAQEPYWPAVETALRNAAKKIHDQRSVAPGAPASLAADDIQQIRTAATPLLGQLREDQKREVRALARVIGLEAVASSI